MEMYHGYFHHNMQVDGLVVKASLKYLPCTATFFLNAWRPFPVFEYSLPPLNKIFQQYKFQMPMQTFGETRDFKRCYNLYLYNPPAEVKCMTSTSNHRCVAGMRLLRTTSHRNI